MNRRLIVLCAMLALVGGAVFAQDLKIDYQVNVAAADAANYFTFTGPIRYMAADKDTVEVPSKNHPDAVSGASKQHSTEMFQPYRLDVKGKNVFPDGLRGLFLFAVSPNQQRLDDNLTATKASDGTITIRYIHRGTAYELVTDKTGAFNFPNGIHFRKRNIGYIQGAGPQVIHSDFSSDGTAAKVDWRKVWDRSIAGGKEIKAGVATKTGTETPDNAAPDSMFYWEGKLQVSLDGNILKIAGGLNAVKR